MDWDTIGEGDHPAQNPPELSENDRFTWNWYFRNTRNYFVMNQKLLVSLIDDLDLDSCQKDLFLMKLDVIHKMDFTLSEKKK